MFIIALLFLLFEYVLSTVPIADGVSLYSDVTNVGIALEFNVRFQILRSLNVDEEIIIYLPRFFQSTDHISFGFNISFYPSSSFWGEFDNETFILHPLRQISLGESISLVILRENGIYVNCGSPSSTVYFGSNYQQQLLLHGDKLISPEIPTLITRFASTQDYSSSLVNFTIFPEFGSKICGSVLNNCSSHGLCDYCLSHCICSVGYDGGSGVNTCSERTCPYGVAVSSIPSFNGTGIDFRPPVECSNKGICNRNTGSCECFTPYEGTACNLLKCPSLYKNAECSGHGLCKTMAELAVIGNSSVMYGTDLASRTVDNWDYNIMRACTCASLWSVGYGDGEYQLSEYYMPDCSLRRCPSGDNPYTCENEEDCYGKNQLGILPYGLPGNKCHVECSNRGTCNRQTGVCTCYPGSTGNNCGYMEDGISLPDCTPTFSPTATPTLTFYPTSVPTSIPTSIPTSMPTSIAFLPAIFVNIVISSGVAAITKNQIIINATIFIDAIDPFAIVYCAPYVVTPFSVQYSPSSADDVIRYGYFSQSVLGVALVTITDLTPGTLYNVYCASITNTGVKSPLATVLSSVIENVQTSCCKNLVWSVVNKLVDGKAVFGGLNVQLESLPYNGTLYLNFSVFGFDSVHYSILTKNITINPNVTSIARSTTIFGSQLYNLDVIPSSLASYALNGPNGQYNLSLTLSGAGAAEYVTTSTNSFIKVVNISAIPDTPVFISAQFSDDGAFVFVTFNADTDRAATMLLSSQFLCSKLLNFTGISSLNMCSFISDSVIKMSVTSALNPGSTLISLAVNAVLKAACIATPVIPCSSWANVDVAVVLTLQYPNSPIKPVVVVTGPKSIGLCSVFTLDFSATTGSGGRNWSYANPIFSLSSSTDTNASALIDFLNSPDFSLIPPTPISASSLLNFGKKYTVLVTLCNFLGGCGSASYFVSVVSSGVIPSVSILGPSTLTMTRSSELLLSSSAFRTYCNGSFSSGNFKYDWYINPAGVDSSKNPDRIISTAVDPSNCKLSAFTLASNQFYTVVLRVTDLIYSTTSKLVFAESQIMVTVGLGSLFAVVSGGQFQSLNIGGSLILDASGSYDEDVSSSMPPTTFIYSWTCIQSSPVVDFNCPFRTNSGNLVVFNLTAISNSNLVDNLPVAIVKLSIKDLSGTRSSSAEINIKTLPALSPVVSILSAVQSPFVSSNQLSLTGYVSSISSCNFAWSTNYSDFNLTAAAASPISTEVIAATPSTEIKKTLYLNLKANTLTKGLSYLFILSCGQSSASVAIKINQGPTSGTFSVLPSTGGFALVTSYAFSSNNWIASNLPLQYEFGYYTDNVQQSLISLNSSESQLSLLSSKASAYGQSILPMGKFSNNYYLNVYCKISDALSTSTEADAVVQVLPFSDYATTTSQSATSVVLDLLKNMSAQSTLSSGTSSTDSQRQIINSFGSSLAAVNCSVSVDCSALNRKPCSTVSFSCGECLSGFTDPSSSVGMQNTPCLNSTNIFLANFNISKGNVLCFTDSDCSGFVYQYCNLDRNRCDIPVKPCINSCSGAFNGNCLYRKIDTGHSVTSCLLNDNSCEPYCSCLDGRGGIDCSLSAEDFANKISTADILTKTLLDLTTVEDPQPLVVTSWLQSAAVLSADSSILSSSSTVQLFSTINNALQSYEKVVPPISVSTALLNQALATVDSLNKATNLSSSPAVVSSLNVSAPSINRIQNIIMNSRTPNQDPFIAIYDTVRILISGFSADEQSGSRRLSSDDFTVSVPRTDYEILINKTLSSFSVPISAFQSNNGQVSGNFALNAQRVVQYGLANSFHSSPVSIQLNNLIDPSTTNVRLLLEAVNTLSYDTEHSPVSFTSVCIPFLAMTYTYVCPPVTGVDGTVTVPNVTHVCDGGWSTSHILFSYCADLVQVPQCTNVASNGIALGTSDCSVVEFTDTYTICDCPLTNNVDNIVRRARTRRLSSSSYVSFPFTDKHISVSVATPIFDEGSGSVTPSTTFAIVALYLVLWLSCIIIFVRYSTYWFGKKNIASKANTVVPIDVERNPLFDECIDNYFREIFPRSFYRGSLTELQCFQESFVKNCILTNIFKQNNVEKKELERILSLATLFTYFTVIVFLVSLFYDFYLPADNGSCVHKFNKSDCLVRRSMFDAGLPYCDWIPIDQTGGAQGPTERCVYREVSVSLTPVLQIGIYICALFVLLASLLHWACEILRAPTRDGFQNAPVSYLSGKFNDVWKNTGMTGLEFGWTRSVKPANRAISSPVSSPIPKENTDLLGENSVINEARNTLSSLYMKDYGGKIDMVMNYLRRKDSEVLSRRSSDVKPGIFSSLTSPKKDDVDSNILHSFESFKIDIHSQYDVLPDWNLKHEFANSWKLTVFRSVAENSTYCKLSSKNSNFLSGYIDESRSKAAVLATSLKYSSEAEIGVKILHGFVLDLIGPSSLVGEIYRNSCAVDTQRVTTYFDKQRVISLIVGINLISIIVAVIIASKRSYDWQIICLCSSIGQLFLVILIYAATVCYTSYLIPNLISVEVSKVLIKLRGIFENFLKTDSLGADNLQILDTPSYLFTSTALARRFPNLLESLAILSYGSYESFWFVEPVELPSLLNAIANFFKLVSVVPTLKYIGCLSKNFQFAILLFLNAGIVAILAELLLFLSTNINIAFYAVPVIAILIVYTVIDINSRGVKCLGEYMKGSPKVIQPIDGYIVEVVREEEIRQPQSIQQESRYNNFLSSLRESIVRRLSQVIPMDIVQGLENRNSAVNNDGHEEEFRYEDSSNESSESEAESEDIVLLADEVNIKEAADTATENGGSVLLSEGTESKVINEANSTELSDGSKEESNHSEDSSDSSLDTKTGKAYEKPTRNTANIEQKTVEVKVENQVEVQSDLSDSGSDDESDEDENIQSDGREQTGESDESASESEDEEDEEESKPMDVQRADSESEEDAKSVKSRNSNEANIYGNSDSEHDSENDSVEEENKSRVGSSDSLDADNESQAIPEPVKPLQLKPFVSMGASIVSGGFSAKLKLNRTLEKLEVSSSDSELEEVLSISESSGTDDDSVE